MRKQKQEKKILARNHCPLDNNELFYFEYNPNWHGMKAMQKTCAVCGMAVALYQLNDASTFVEAQEIEKELAK